MLAINGLDFSYDKKSVLYDLSLQVERGDIVSLLGTSGCGKTTLLKLITGVMLPQRGTVTLDGTMLSGDSHYVTPQERNIGMIFQDYALFPHLNVFENVAFGLHKVPKKERITKVQEVLSLVHLDVLQNKYPHELSGGQQQRVAMARTLVCKPRLVLLDEPFSNIDEHTRHEIINEIRQLLKQQQITAICVTHNREEAFSFADKIAVMHQGKILQYDNPKDIYSYPKSTFVSNFLGSGSYLTARYQPTGRFMTPLGEFDAVIHDERVRETDAALLIRPQNVTIEPTDNNAGYRIVSQQFMGDYYRYKIQVAGDQLLAFSSQALDVGVSVKVSICQSQPPILAFSKDDVKPA